MTGVSRSEYWLRQAVLIVTIVASVASLFTLARAASHTRYLADDFGIARTSNEESFLEFQRSRYLATSGRISTNAVLWLFGRMGPGFNTARPALILFLFLLSSLAFVRATGFFPDQPATSLALALMWTMVVFNFLPSIFQTLVWFAGSVVYALPLVLLHLWGAAVAISIRESSPALRTASAATAFLLAMMMGTFNEIILAMGASGIAAVLLLAPAARRRGLPVLLSSFAGFLVAALIVLYTPGVAARRAAFAVKLDLSDIITRSVTGSFELLQFELLERPLAWLALMLFVMTLQSRNRITWRLAAASTIIFAVILPMSLAPALYGISGFPPMRALSQPHVATGLWLVVIAAWAGSELNSRKAIRVTLTTAAMIATAALGVVAVSLNLSSESTMRHFASQWDERDTLLKAAAAQGIDQVAITSPIGFEGIGVLTRDPSHWLNEGMASYYGLDIIVGIPPESDSPPSRRERSD